MSIVESARPEGAHQLLRRETRVWHREVERAFEVFDLRTATGLRGFLCAQARAILPLERALDREGVGTMLPDWPLRRRGEALIADLARLDVAPPSGSPLPPLATPAQRFGTLYVLEGSRLGGSVLARLVASGSDPELALPTSFLRHSPGAGAWSAFLAQLNAADPDREELLVGAGAAFGMFHNAALTQASAQRLTP